MEGNYNNLFNYKITYSKKRKKTIGFKVENNILNIISPLKVSKKFLLSFLEKKKDWVINIIKKRNSLGNIIGDIQLNLCHGTGKLNGYLTGFFPDDNISVIRKDVSQWG